jgi:hypothetical protein
MPNRLAHWGRSPLRPEPFRQSVQAAPGAQIAGKEFLHQDALDRFDPDACWIARALDPEAIAVGRDRPGQEQASL